MRPGDRHARAVPRQLFVQRPRRTYGQPLQDEDLSPGRTVLAEHAQDIAEVIIEPVVQGAGGMRLYSADYLRELVVLCRA